MKRETKAAVAMFAVVVAGGAVSAAVFVFVGSQMAVYATVGIVPVLALAGLLWVRGTVKRTGTSQSEITKRRAREVGERFAEAWAHHERMHQAFPDLVPADPRGGEKIVADLDEQGVEFDRESASISLSRLSSRDIESLNRIEDAIADFEDDRDRAFAENVREEVRSLNRAVADLSDVTSVQTPLDPGDVADPPPDRDGEWWESVADDVRTHREAVAETVGDAVEAVRSTVASSSDVDGEAVERALTEAEDALDRGEFETAVEHVHAARDELRTAGGDSFRSARRDLLTLVEAARQVDVDTYLDFDFGDRLDEREREIEALEDATDMAALAEERTALRDLCTDVVAGLESELDRLLDVLDGADLPEGYYWRPEVADEDPASDLQATDSVPAFTEAFERTVDDLADALDRTSTKADVAQGYDEMSERIESVLRSSGRVTPADLPVKRHEDQFMGLYAREHDGVTYDPDEPVLTADSTETYTVEVRAKFESGGSERDVTVGLDGDGRADSETVTTPLTAKAVFEDVPYGEYTVRAEPAPEDSATAEETVQVDEDTEVRLEMADVSLRERVCADVGPELDQFVADLGPKLSDRFEADGYLDTGMSYSIDDEYVPCLLVTWASREGHDVVETDDGILVYDDDLLTGELENVVRYNLDAGEEMSFERLRVDFLSVPAPDAAIRELVAESAADESVSLTENALTKTEAE